MRSQQYVLFFGAVVWAMCVATVSAEPQPHCGKGGKGGGFMERFKKCGDGEMNKDVFMKGMKECFKKPGGGDERRKRSPGKGGKGGWMKKKLCAMVCQWKLQGVLDDKGAFSESGAADFAKKAYPESKANDAAEKIKACGKEHSSKFSMDDNCAGYGDYSKCVMKGHMEVCGIKFGGKGKGGGGGGKPKNSDEQD